MLTRTRATATTRWMPRRSMRAAEKGAASPKSTRLTETAPPMTPIGQPNSSCSGVMSTPGVDRNPAAPMIVRKVTTATHHAGWMRRGPAAGNGGPWTVSSAAECRSVMLTGQDCGIREPANEWPDGHHVQESGHETAAAVRTSSSSLPSTPPSRSRSALPHRFLARARSTPAGPDRPRERPRPTRCAS